jgi:hypothetical protein
MEMLVGNPCTELSEPSEFTEMRALFLDTSQVEWYPKDCCRCRGAGVRQRRSTMAYQSPVMLERQFFRVFFAALVAEGYTAIDWRNDDTDARFRCVYEYLRSQRNRGRNVARLVDRLRPDPLSGSSPALDTNLMHMQPGPVRASNPSYEGVQLSASSADFSRLLGNLPEDLRSVIQEAAGAFIKKTSVPVPVSA